jgi:lipopolysaccharide export system protein LptA
MYKPFIKKLVVNCTLGICLITSTAIQAAKTDLDKDIIIHSQRQAGDLKNKIISYLDDVLIKQGSLTISADLVQVYEVENGKQKIYVAKGKPAVFKQLLDDGTPINLQAEEITYEPAKHVITISGNASVSQQGSFVKGSKIIYNTLTEQLLAESNPDESVTTILKSQPKAQAKEQP